MKLFGTTTSPYTRKVRILLKGLVREHQLIDIRTESGAAAFAAAAPLGKSPVLVTDGQGPVLSDSSSIVNWLWMTEGFTLRAAGWSLDPFDWADRGLQVAVEGALDAAINHRYLRLDGFAESGYIAKQRQRFERTLGWLDGRITFGRQLGAAALSLGCALDWMAFREVADLSRWPGLVAFRAAWQSAGVGAGSEPRE